MNKRCIDCDNLFEVETNPKTSIKMGVNHRTKLCEKCWLKHRNINFKGNTYNHPKGKGIGKINLDSNSLRGYNKKDREEILIRNDKIKRLQEIIDSLTKENIKLKDELKILKWTRK